MKKVLFVATVVKTHIMEFHVPYLKMFKEMGWETAVAARNDYERPEDCIIPYCDTYYAVPFERNPVKPQNIKNYKALKQIIDSGEYDIIHCHTPVGAMLTRLAGQAARKKGTKIIYTAHGFHFYKGAPLINWLLYYPVEKLLAKYTDVLITINKEDYKRAKAKLKTKQIEYVPGVGIDTGRFSPDSAKRTKKRAELGLTESDFVLLSVGELNLNKNHRVVIEALQELHNCHYVLCGSGPLMDKYKQLAASLGVADRVLLAGYRTDVPEFYNMADAFVFPSLREGLPVALMEAMTCGLPIVCSNIRGNTDLIENGVNGYLVSPTDVDGIANAIKLIRDNPALKMGENNIAKAKAYDIKAISEEYRKIYLG